MATGMTSKTVEAQGFTLIELLLAIFIFGIVVSVVYGSYSSTFLLINSTGKKMEVAGKAGVALEMISNDLSSIIRGKGGFMRGEEPGDPETGGDLLTFVSSMYLGLTREDEHGGLSIIKYSTEQDEESGLLKLYRAAGRILPGQDRNGVKLNKYLLCDGLQEVNFLYYDGDGIENNEYHYDGAQPVNAGNSMPAMVSLSLQFSDGADSENFSIFTTSLSIQQVK